ncbi:MAG: DinB family protein [Sphingobacteriales bacterium]|nr:MAG: DinB family protein [Sphingobacteriales bacterium]
MNIIELLLKELHQEAAITRKMLSIVPDDKYDYKPHAKSMTIKSLATHIAELPTWISLAVNTDGLDFAAAPYNPEDINDNKSLLALFEKSLAEGKKALEEAKEENLDKEWVLRSGDQIFSKQSKYETIRHAFAQTIHHRAQLGVYLRLNNIAIPGSYGPSADEMGM